MIRTSSPDCLSQGRRQRGNEARRHGTTTILAYKYAPSEQEVQYGGS